VRVPGAPTTTPPAGDTVGYWQQRADYTIVARLDERRGVAVARGTLRYVNASPDTLRELWVHQHLNAFRPGSRWAEADEREGRLRYQALRDPAFGYERFTAPPTVNGRALAVSYPLAPDSTVVRLALRQPLHPGDSVEVALAWEARPSTVPRRQGRRGRSYDFAQWYPKVALYDRTGWRPNALVPAGEFAGEFGTFDVTLVLPDDQVVAATGVPVAGDPGWARVRAPGSAPPRLASGAYGALPTPPAVSVPRRHRAVRFHARHVHHFAWSASPGFVYEGTTWVRPPARAWRVPVWDTVAVHVLYRGDADAECAAIHPPGAGRAACVADARTDWAGARALGHARTALGWLEALYGDYPWPQLTVVKRLDGGGTEYPMLVGNGSASLGLMVHEVGHQFAYGALANTEWQDGWLDEGLTTYQELLQAGESRVLLAARLAMAGDRDPSAPRDTALRALRARLDSASAELAGAVRDGRAEPAGTRADLFGGADAYEHAVYDRGSALFQALHDVMGEEAFQQALRDYYARWQFRHVDRWALQRAAEAAHGASLAWFFDQWVTAVGAIDYALRAPRVRREAGPGGRATWVVTATLVRVGAYRHPMPVGVRTAAGWTVVRGDPARDVQEVELRTTAPPDALWLDPWGAADAPSARYYRVTLPATGR
jgi:hypothetical protein